MTQLDPAYAFTMFIDDSGQRENNAATTRHFVYAGTIVSTSAVIALENELHGIKRAFLGDRDAEIKSNWLRRDFRERYLEKYGISKPKLDEFTDAIYSWVDHAPITFIAAVIDKDEAKEGYKHPFYPSTLAYQYLLQRFDQFLRSHSATGQVVMDDLTGKTKAGRKWKTLIQRHHRKLKKRGCNFTKIDFKVVGSTLRFEDSRKFGLIQISDLCAYNVLRQFKDHGKEWDEPKSKSLPIYSFLGRMLPKFRQIDGVFAGYGIVKAPTKKPINRWSIKAA